jgi:hypothetical protein
MSGQKQTAAKAGISLASVPGQSFDSLKASSTFSYGIVALKVVNF